jgi:long-chain acyl-CoA synthetase
MNTVPELFLSAVNKFPDNEAVIEGERSVAYSGIRKLVEKFSSHLASLGIAKGDRVLILLPNSIEFVTAFFGIASLGAVSVPVSTAFKKEEIEFYLEHSGARLTVTEPGFAELLKEPARRTGSLVSVVTGSSADWHLRENGPPDFTSVDPGDEAIYLYSTGSTGRPKRVARTHRNLIALADNHTQTVGWTERDRVLFTIPMSHTYGFGNFISSIKIGASIVAMGEFNRARVLEAIEKESVTVFPAVPVILDALSRTRLSEPRDVSSLTLIISAGAPLPEPVFRGFHSKYGLHPRQLYGSTETGVISINLGDSIEKRFNSVGRAVKNVVVKVFNDDGSEARPGQVGELAVKSPSMTTGYYGLPEETDKVFRGGFYFTGDLGRIDEEGYIYIVGRKKLFINISGNKVDPGEVENLLSTHPRVLEAVVLGVRDEKGGELVKAVLVTDGELSHAQVLEFCKDRIAGYKIPRIIEFRRELPRSPSGKVLRERLK